MSAEARLSHIRLLALDIDGVLTDGTVYLDETGRESKRLSYRDIDAIFQAHRAGLRLALLTGENTPWVEMIARRLQITLVYAGAKDKVAALRRLAIDANVPVEEIAYIGDSDRDAPALRMAGLGLTPADATPAAQKAADIVIESPGGQGVVAKVVAMILGTEQE